MKELQLQRIRDRVGYGRVQLIGIRIQYFQLDKVTDAYGDASRQGILTQIEF